ncbi:hypothetical protein CC78DRAFT_531794 [Lojkania enalia]|uniref:Uncharacterized protein n=1 Tax=Lojkania enalia TaxID=147567 RepID=A0A9P4KBV2_9PLEO|nr:hypothetical protein CC78DRAFT_531794 [Didymosphaeria enalia]
MGNRYALGQVGRVVLLSIARGGACHSTLLSLPRLPARGAAVIRVVPAKRFLGRNGRRESETPGRPAEELDVAVLVVVIHHLP